jgi:hypothetical protein
VPNRRRRPPRATAILAIAAVALSAGIYLAYRHVQAISNGCQANSGANAVSLDTSQGAIAATIAGVAHARRLITGAVTIAYATAMQESHMHNLPAGDLDSVGVFQQRPSQGWGPAAKLRDPVYATGKFFDALVKVPQYLHIPVDQAAQAVQRSADGSAYAKYQQQAAGMASAFTGRLPHAVWCWYSPGSSGTPEMAAVRSGLLHAFGRLDVRETAGSSGGDPGGQVRVRYRAVGWTVASWLVTHATEYRISNVRYAGYQWNASAGNRGWTLDPSAPSGSVRLR